MSFIKRRGCCSSTSFPLMKASRSLTPAFPRRLAKPYQVFGAGDWRFLPTLKQILRQIGAG